MGLLPRLAGGGAVTPESGLDTASLLSACDLCGCLVVASSLRARAHFAATREGTLRKVTHVVCEDVAACYARAIDPPSNVRL